MLIKPNKFEEIYKTIKTKRSNSIGTTETLLISACDPDAVCASRILALLLERDCVSFKLVAVASYSHVNVKDLGLKSVFFIGCGAIIDINEFCNLSDVDFILLDSHRPVNLQNLFGNDNVLIINLDLCS